VKRLVIISILSLFSCFTYAEDNPYVVGIENYQYFPFYSPVGYDGLPRARLGVAYEILQSFSKDKGYPFEFKAMPIVDLCSSLESGEIDFKFPYEHEWDCPGLDKTNVSQSEGFIPYIDGALIHKDRQGVVLEEVSRMGMMSGFTPFGYVEQIEEGNIQVVEYEAPEELIADTVDGKIDIAYIGIDAGFFVLRNKVRQPDILVFAENLPHRKSSYRFASKNHSEVIEQFNIWLEENQEKIKYISGNYGLR